MKKLCLLAITTCAWICFGPAVRADDSAIEPTGGIARQRIIKDQKKIALAQLTVYYKTITTVTGQAHARTLIGKSADKASGRCSAYLDVEMTDQDFQGLTDQFYRILGERFTKLGLELVPYETAIKAPGMVALIDSRQKDLEKQKAHNDKIEGGQSWLAFNSFNGPTIYHFGPEGGIVIGPAFSAWKTWEKASEDVGAPFLMANVTIDFARIGLELSHSESQHWNGVTVRKAGKMQADDRVRVVAGNILIHHGKKQEGYVNRHPIRSPVEMKAQLNENPDLPRLKTNRLFGATTFAFAPVQVTPTKENYKAAVIGAMEAYADELLAAVKANNKL